MAYPYIGAVQQHSDHVEPVRLRLPAVAIDPDHGRALQLFLFAPVNCLNRTAELAATPGLHFNEGHHPLPLDDQIDVAMAATKPALNHPPASLPEPPLRDSFPEFAKRLPGR